MLGRLVGSVVGVAVSVAVDEEAEGVSIGAGLLGDGSTLGTTVLSELPHAQTSTSTARSVPRKRGRSGWTRGSDDACMSQLLQVVRARGARFIRPGPARSRR